MNEAGCQDVEDPAGHHSDAGCFGLGRARARLAPDTGGADRNDAARRAARHAGLAGALFPWQSGSDGREETPEQLFNLRSGRWMADNSRRQRHIGLAVAFNAWQHYQSTGDTAWLAERGAELIIEVARLVASLATHDPDENRFHIEGVMGPDECHDGYPDTPGAGLRDNAYTNVLAAWVFERAADTVEPFEDDRDVEGPVQEPAPLDRVPEVAHLSGVGRRRWRERCGRAEQSVQESALARPGLFDRLSRYPPGRVPQHQHHHHDVVQGSDDREELGDQIDRADHPHRRDPDRQLG